MSKSKGFKTATTSEKEWCAERYGELGLDNPGLHPELRKKRRAQLFCELLDRHDLSHTPENKQEMEVAYRTSLPSYSCFSEKYRVFVEKGKSKNFTTENLQLLGSLAIHDAQALHLTKQAISEAFINNDFSVVNEKGMVIHPHPQLLEIFKIGVYDGYAPDTDRDGNTETADITNKFSHASAILEALDTTEEDLVETDEGGE